MGSGQPVILLMSISMLPLSTLYKKVTSFHMFSVHTKTKSEKVLKFFWFEERFGKLFNMFSFYVYKKTKSGKVLKFFWFKERLESSVFRTVGRGIKLKLRFQFTPAECERCLSRAIITEAVIKWSPFHPRVRYFLINRKFIRHFVNHTRRIEWSTGQ